jgi:hypothetical protein
MLRKKKYYAMQYINGYKKYIFVLTNYFPGTPSLQVGDFVE